MKKITPHNSYLSFHCSFLVVARCFTAIRKIFSISNVQYSICVPNQVEHYSIHYLKFSNVCTPLVAILSGIVSMGVVNGCGILLLNTLIVFDLWPNSPTPTDDNVKALVCL